MSDLRSRVAAGAERAIASAAQHIIESLEPTNHTERKQSMDSIPLSDMTFADAAKFTAIGDKYAGTIVSFDKRQQTDPATQAPKCFPNGEPMMVTVITIEQPDGDQVALWARGGRFKVGSGSGMAMLQAIGAAVEKAGATSLDVGGKLAVAHTGMGEATTGKNPPRLFTAQYKPGAAKPQSIEAADLFDGPPPAEAPPEYAEDEEPF